MGLNIGTDPCQNLVRISRTERVMPAGEWYVAEGGKVLGPFPMSELVAMASKASPLLVWAEGLDDWTEAGEVEALRRVLRGPAPAEQAPSVEATPAAKPLLRDRAKRELIEYAAIAVYLYICFLALALYKTAILRGEGVSFAPYGFAIAKALILGKFLLLLRAAKLDGPRVRARRMIQDIARNALLFAILLCVLSVLEEVIVGWFHGKTPAAVLADMTGHSVLQVVATALLMVLILIPYFGYVEITERLGEGVLLRMLLEPRARRENREGHAGKHSKRHRQVEEG
jgi:hypothetical protein